MNKTAIEWCTHTWNPITGCKGPNGTPCPYCYAQRIYQRFGWSFRPTLHNHRLGEPMRVRESARIFVCSVADPFGDGVERHWLHQVFAAMQGAARHTYYLLTKRPDRIAELVEGCYVSPVDMPQLWLGVTVTCEADLWRVDTLLQTPAAHRFVSIEPLLGEVDLRPYVGPGRLEWVIVGAMTGPGATLPRAEWVRDIRQTCGTKLYAGERYVPLFEKHNLAPVMRGVQLRQEFTEA